MLSTLMIQFSQDSLAKEVVYGVWFVSDKRWKRVSDKRWFMVC